MTFIQSSRRGLTKGDLIALIAALAVLGCVLVMWMQRARETARRGECERRMQTLTRGLIMLREERGRLPLLNGAPRAPDGLSTLGRVAPGAIGKAESDWEQDGYSWLVALLPYLEEDRRYDQIQQRTDQFQRPAFAMSTSIGSLANGATNREKHPAEIPLAAVHCPSFGGARWSQAPDNYGWPADRKLAGSNYVALAAATRGARTPGIVDDADPEWGGPFAAPRAAPPDLAAQVAPSSPELGPRLMVCETKQERFSSWFSGQSTWVTGFLPDEPLRIARNTSGLLEFAADSSLGQPGLNRGCRLPPRSAAPPAPGLSNGSAAPTPRPYSQSLAGGERDWGPSSDHVGGVVLHGFTDGASQFLSDQIDPTVYLQMFGGRPPVAPPE